MKVIKCLGFFLLAVVVFMGFVLPFSIVPKSFEGKARAMALERAEKGSLAVKDSYIDESVNDAVRDNIFLIFKTAFIISAVAALVIYCLSLRAPHDCGGLNWFNPLGLIFAAGISVLTALTVGLLLKSSSSASAAEFTAFMLKLTGSLTYQGNRLLFIIMVPIVLEAVFRGIIFSYLEKIHFTVGIVLSTLAYAIAAYLAVGSYMKWSTGSSAAGLFAAMIAAVIGFAESITVWQLRSVIPAMLSHIFIAYSARQMQGYIAAGKISLPVAAIALLAVLALMVLVFGVLGKKVKVLACDFPLTKHHGRMENWLRSTRSVFEKKVEEAEKKIESKVRKTTKKKKAAK